MVTTALLSFPSSALADVKEPSRPRSVFGYVAEGLRRRKAASLPVTILSCDNLQHNGEVARRAFLAFFERQDPELAAWAREQVSFPCCM